MTVRYDIKQVTRYILIRKGQKAVKVGFSTTPTATYDYDMTEFKRYDDAELAAYALIRDLGAQHDSLGLRGDDRPNFEVKPVTRYILTRTMNTDQGATVADLAEFKRRDDAERVMGTMRAAIHPVGAIDADNKPLGRDFKAVVK